MERHQAARLLGISPMADGTEAHQALVNKLSELAEWSQRAPSEAVQAKYERVRSMLQEAAQVMEASAVPVEGAGGEPPDLRSPTPQSWSEATDESIVHAKSAADLAVRVAMPRPARSRVELWIGLVGLVVVLLAVLAGTGILDKFWKSIRPLGDDERRGQVQETSRLKAEIEALQDQVREMQQVAQSEERRLHFQQASRLKAEIEALQEQVQTTRRAAQTEKRDTESEVRRIEGQLPLAQMDSDGANSSSQLQQAKMRLALADKVLELQERLVLGGNRLSELQLQLAEAERLTDPTGDQNLAAVEQLRMIRAGYEDLVERLGGSPARAEAWWDSEAALRDWASLSAGKSLPVENEQVSSMRQRHTQAEALSNDERAISEYRAVATMVNQLRIDVSARLQAEAPEEGEQQHRAALQGEGAHRAELARQVIPEMVIIPAGSFRMGCSLAEGDCRSDENPPHEVKVSVFRLGKYEVTFAQYDVFAEATGRKRPDDGGWGRGSRPVINVSWDDAQAFVEWLSNVTEKRFRLPTEAEWEYSARGGTTTAYPWGSSVGRGNANCSACGSQWDDRQTAPVGRFGANPFGLYDMQGNVLEWVADCWNGSYVGAPTDGSAWRRGDCAQRVVRGGSWWSHKDMARSDRRHAFNSTMTGSMVGFRVAQDIP